jgi:hypothetical protein
MTDDVEGQDVEGAALPPATPRDDKTAKLEAPVRDKDGKFLPTLRGKLREAILLMGEQGVSSTLAAQRAGVRIDNLNKALKRPYVIMALNQMFADVKANAAQQAYIRNVRLAETSDSDHVKADLNKWVAGVDGIAALKRVEGKHTVSHTFGGFEYGSRDNPDAIDAQVIDDGADNQSGDHGE